MPARRLSDAAIIVGAGVMIAVLGGVGALIGPAPDPGRGTSSTYSAGPAGARAAYLTLRRLGYEVDRSIEPLTAFTADPPATVLILSGQNEASEQDKRALDRFVRSGGVVLTVGERGAELLRATPAEAQLPQPFVTRETDVHRPVMPSPLTEDASEITMSPTAPVSTLGAAYSTLYGAERAVVASARIGEGRAVWWAAATPLTNQHILERDNLPLLLNVVGRPGERRVVWDEHYHGHIRSLWSYVAGTPLVWAAVQIGLLGCAGLLTYSRRQGPVRAAATDGRTSPMEFVEMLGALYKRAAARNAAVATARGRLRRTVISSCGLPAHSADSAIARAAAARAAVEPDVVEALLAESGRAAADPGLDAARALELTRRLQVMTARTRGLQR